MAKKAKKLNKEIVKLEFQDAIDLWLKGKEEWNKWADELKSLDNLDHTEIFFTESPVSTNESGRIHYKVHGNKWIGNANKDWPFTGYIFPKAKLIFRNCFFTANHNSFEGAEFNGGSVKFIDCEFSGDVSFEAATLNDTKFEFINCKFQKKALFKNLVNTNNVKQFSFTRCDFTDVLEISSNTYFGCVVDLIRSNFGSFKNGEFFSKETKKPVELQGLYCKPDSKLGFQIGLNFQNFPINIFEFYKIYDSTDLTRLDVLREIAEQNNDHSTALRFRGDKMRLMRWDGKYSGFWDSIFDALYSITSGYGRSAGKPFYWLISLFFIFTYFYLKNSNTGASIGSILQLSFANTLPLFPGAGALRESIMMNLIPDDKKSLMYIYSFIHGTLSLVLIFLIGLGFRNRYKIKF